MKRQLIAVGLAAFALSIFAFISATMAAPQNMPTADTEPDNDNIEGADLVTVGGHADGDIDPPEDLDYYVVNTEVGREYQASLAIWNSQNLKLKMFLYYGNPPHDYVTDSPASSSSTSMSWSAYQTSYYILVQAASISTTTAEYRLSINRVAATPTATPEDPWDAYEPNDNFGDAQANPLPFGTSITLEDLNFHPHESQTGQDQDWFAFYAKDGSWYRAKTDNLVNVDTYMEIRNQDNNVVESNDNDGDGFASKVKWQASYSGYYYVRITNRVGSSGGDDTYDLTIEELGPTPTPTPGPTATPKPGPTAIPGIDQFEPNYDFAHASTIGTDITYEANFIPWGGGAEDNDFYKLWIKPGLHFVCETLELAPGVDTNMIVYDGNQNAIGGNDDVELGDYRSRFAYFSTYEGWLYILIGHGGRLPASELKNSDYNFRCEMRVPGEPTATSTPRPEDTPKPTAAAPTPAGSPIATPVPPENLTVRPLTTPTPVAATTPAPRFIPITLLVYYDGNDDRQPGAGEGIAGISAQAYEVATNQLLAQGFTDEQGNLEFTAAAQGPVRVSVPFFGFSQLVAGEGASIYLRVPPQPLPGGAP